MSDIERDYYDEACVMAQQVMRYGFSWVDDGPAIQKIIFKLTAACEQDIGAYWAQMSLDEQKAIVLGNLLELATRYKWDAPRMGVMVEAAFLRFMVTHQLDN